MNEKQFFKATVTGKRQITIPKDICEFLNIEKGNQVIFKKEDSKIIFEVEKNYKTCFACNGTTKIESKECFVCNGEGIIEKSIIEEVYRLIGMIGTRSRKHKIAFSFIQQQLGENGEVAYMDYPTIKLSSKEYSTDELLRVQDEIQKLIIEQLSPRINLNEKLFCIPSDSSLNRILDILSTEKAKEEVTKWFR